MLFQLLFGSLALGNMVRDGKTHQIRNLIRQGKREGMILMDDALYGLVKEGTVSAENAYEKATDKIEFRKQMRSLGHDVGVAMADEETLDLEAMETAQQQQAAPAAGGDTDAA